MLNTLNDVTLTLGELSKSGVGRAVRKLKKEPGLLGQTAKFILSKWKQLLDQHIEHEHNLNSSNAFSKSHQIRNLTNPCMDKELIHSSSIDTLNTNCSTSIDDINEVSLNNRNNSLNKNNNNNNIQSNGFNLVIRKRPSDKASPSIACPTKIRKAKNEFVQKSKIKTIPSSKLTSIDGVDSSSGLSFMDSLNMDVGSRSDQKNRIKTRIKGERNEFVPNLFNVEPSTIGTSLSPSFTDEILSSLSDSFNEPAELDQSDRQPSVDENDLQSKVSCHIFLINMN